MSPLFWRGVMAAVLALLAGGARSGEAAWTTHMPAPALAAAGLRSQPSWLLTLDGNLLETQNADLRRAPASLTKLLTALVVLDAHWSSGQWLDVSAAAAGAEPSRVGLRAGDSLLAGDALVAMLVHSANDACAVLVEHAASSQSAFLQLMNQRALALGMTASHFSAPCGFDAPDQYATAADLLRLGTAAWQNPLIRHIAALQEAQLRTRGGRTLAFRTTNALLGRLDGVVGLKTGYTSGAGQCLIAVAERGQHVVWLVMLGANDRWWGAHRMISDALTGQQPSEPPR